MLGGGNCDYSLRAAENLATPLTTVLYFHLTCTSKLTTRKNVNRRDKIHRPYVKRQKENTDETHVCFMTPAVLQTTQHNEY
jgi:hypothetical protein